MAKITRPTRARGPRKASATFEQQLVLFDWLLRQVGARTWTDLPLDAMRAAEREAWPEGPSPYARALASRLFGDAPLDEASLYAADARIADVTARLNARRDSPIRWKYFQWLALLFTELYLDRWLSDPERLRRDLNLHLTDLCAEGGFSLPAYGTDEDTGADDLAKVAFWQATGSGKTLILHANLLQYRAACERHGIRQPDRVLLVTPNAGLSAQHARELAASGLHGQIFRAQDLPDRSADVVILEVTKLADRPGVETVATSQFEGSNLVFVDEGHRGSSKEDGEWRRRRQQLSAGGFCFEYSATFKQAAEKSDLLRDEYARAILIDYSYRRFHADGYGKHWRILNLEKDDAKARREYFTSALLTLFQQAWLHEQHPALVATHDLSKPLCVFVGGSVVGGDESKEQTDVVKVLAFLSDFVRDPVGSKRVLRDLLDGKAGFVTKKKEDVFKRDFPALAGWDEHRLYQEMLRLLFNAPGSAPLHIEELKDAAGEIALSVGAAPPFGVVNVGDAPGLRKKCVEDKEHGPHFVVDEKRFKGGLFHRIDEPGSRLTMLVGSRKFSEGWSSWRVSLMGLLNLGKSPGTQIVQLFGRGVRLKGRGMSLKRGDAKGEPLLKGDAAWQVPLLETFSVFGVESSYMKLFREELEKAGIEPGGAESEEDTVRTLPVIRTRPLPRLWVMRPPTREEFRRSGETVTLEVDPHLPPVLVEGWASVEVHDDQQKALSIAESNRIVDVVPAFAFVDHQALYADLVRLKNEQGFWNLALPRTAQHPRLGAVPLTRALLATPGWYVLEVEDRDVEATSLRNRALWQRYASELVRGLARTLYRARLGDWQLRNTSFVELDDMGDKEIAALIPDAWIVTVEPGSDWTAKILALVDTIGQRLRQGERVEAGQKGVFEVTSPEMHLYHPLVGATDPKKAILRVTTEPVALNEGEIAFVRDLAKYLATRPRLLDGAHVHLLRNPAKKGVGFEGFYPDFIVWVVRGEEQWVIFVDPKGLSKLGPADPKLHAWKKLKELEARHRSRRIHLDSWIVSVTEQAHLKWEVTDFTAMHVLFGTDKGYVETLFERALAADVSIWPQGAEA